jgi:hypothetical protein
LDYQLNDEGGLPGAWWTLYEGKIRRGEGSIDRVLLGLIEFLPKRSALDRRQRADVDRAGQQASEIRTGGRPIMQSVECLLLSLYGSSGGSAID